MDDRELVGQKLLLAFRGKHFTSEMAAGLKKYRPAGITFFRNLNLDNPQQVLTLTTALQQRALDLGLPRLLLGADQEGGQLMAVGNGTTPLPGNMALGAAGSSDLARQAGEVLGSELAAMGINMDYAPCCDVNVNPNNPVIGTRSFGEDPKKVSELAAAMIHGIQSQGVAAVAKHFPGHGDTVADSHHGLPSLPHQLDRLRAVEFPPFQGAIEAEVKLVMSAHLSLPAIDGEDAPPATLSRKILQGILRQEIGFTGVIVSDAMDMHAIAQGEKLGSEAIRAVNAGIDLLLMNSNGKDTARVYSTLLDAVRHNLITPDNIAASVDRIQILKRWLADHQSQPGLEIVGCSGHLAIATEIAERSITLVRDHAKLLPLKLTSNQRVIVVLPKPSDLTPADTSSYIRIGLTDAVREYHSNLEEIHVSQSPDEAEVHHILQKIDGAALVICGTINAYHSEPQAALVRGILKSGVATIIVAMRLPYDLIAFPEAPTYLCTYGILMPSIQAFTRVLFGQIKPRGRLPVSIPGLYQTGDGLI